MNGRKLVVFDVDGTICDSQNHIVAAMAHAFANEGLQCPERAMVLGIVGLSLPEAMARLVPDLPVTIQNRLVAGYKSGYFAERAAGLAPLYDGMRDVIDTLAERNDVALGVATGKSRRGLDHLLHGHRLEGKFVTRQVADDHPSKPHPSMLLAAMSEAGVPPERTVMIGDTTYDVAMGKAAGVSTLAVAWGYHGADALAAAAPRRMIGAVAQIAQALDEIWGPA